MAPNLIVEDDPKQLRLYSRVLRGCRLTCVRAGIGGGGCNGEAIQGEGAAAR